MKNVLVSLAAASLLLLSGCSQKNPDVDDTVNNSAEVVNETSTGTSGNDMDSILAKLKGELGSVYFNYDRFNIRPDMQSVVSNDARLLNNQEVSQFAVKIEGNCDEWGTDEYNMALGLKRAMSVKKSLVSKGVSADRIQTVSYGKNNPVCSEKTKACWAKNRRVDVQPFAQ